MGKIGKTIIKLDIAKLQENLNEAMTEERLACYQYWLGFKVVKVPKRKSIEAELKEHAKEEYSHTGQIAERIIRLGGSPYSNLRMPQVKTANKTLASQTM